MITDFSIFKDFEKDFDPRANDDSILVFRLDGVGFSKFTKQFEKPFSPVFEHGMNKAASVVREKVFNNALVTFVASDEISFIVSNKLIDLPYAGRLQKLLSLSASYAGLGFMKAVECEDYPAFDSRVFTLPDASFIRDYLPQT